MKVQAFLEKTYSKIKEQFATAKVEYEFSRVTDTHYVKITPDEIFNSGEFLKLKGELYHDWYSVVDNEEESFCFLSSDSLVQLENPTLIYEPEFSSEKVIGSSFKVEIDNSLDELFSDSLSFLDSLNLDDTSVRNEFLDSSIEIFHSCVFENKNEAQIISLGAVQYILAA